jgi:hypothetical protein
MSIKDNLVSAFIKGFVISRAQVFDQPGFIIFRITGKTDIYTRQVIFPESIFVNLEKKLIEKFGQSGKQLLYSTGKKWGYRFAAMQNFTRRSETKSNSEFLSFVNIMNTFIGGTYAKSMDYEFDFEKTLAKFELCDFVVVRVLGFDYFLALGGAAGLWCYLLERNDIEGIQIGGVDGTILCEYSFPANLSKKDLVLVETDLTGLDPEKEYRSLNAISSNKFSKKSFSEYLNTKVFSHDAGAVSLGKVRFFLFEACGMYLLERALTTPLQKNLLFEVSVDSGKEIVGQFKSPSSLLVSEVLSALGWGDILILQKNSKVTILVEHFPWTKFYNEIDFVIFSGLLSGMLSTVLNRPIALEVNKKNITTSLCLVLSEK